MGNSWFAGSHDLRFGYEFIRTGRPVKVWSTSGLRGNFANGVPTTANTYLVSVTKVGDPEGSDIPICARAVGTVSVRLHPGQMERDP